MITFRLRPKYNRKEINLLLDIFLTAEAELYNTNNCRLLCPNCTKCSYKHLCKDIKNAVHHLSKR